MIKLITPHLYFEKKPNKQMDILQNNSSIGWVHPKSTHVCPLAWGNKHTPPTLIPTHYNEENNNANIC